MIILIISIITKMVFQFKSALASHTLQNKQITAILITSSYEKRKFS